MRPNPILACVAISLTCAVGAYWLGTRHAASSASAPVSGPTGATGDPEANRSRPYALQIPPEVTLSPDAVVPTGSLANPTGVLLGEVEIPKDLLRAPEPATRPEFIVPDLGR